jgi:uncharacterized membrane protein
MAVYGAVLFLIGIAYLVLQRVIIVSQGPKSVLTAAVGGDMKGNLSLLVYAIAIPFSFVQPWVAGMLYVAVATIWLVPDRRIERSTERGGYPRRKCAGKSSVPAEPPTKASLASSSST